MSKRKLYIVATPIGNLGDISERAVEILNSVTLIAAEDTRYSGKLLNHYRINTKMISLHEHNEKVQHEKIIQRLLQGESVALISDSGTPLISDPGYQLVSAAKKQDIEVIPIPGPCAAIVALSASGLPTDKFIFEGFLSSKQHARSERLKLLTNESRTMIFYEAPHRIIPLLEDMLQVFGSNRYVVLSRELTKIHETIHGDSLQKLLSWIKDNSEQQRGEFVVLVSGKKAHIKQDITNEDLQMLQLLAKELPLSKAASIAAKITGKKKSMFYKKSKG